MTPGTVNSPDRAPPPMVSAASSTCTSKPLRAKWIAAASPLGPAPPPPALVMSPALPRKQVEAPPAAERRGGVTPPDRCCVYRRRRASSRSVGAVCDQMDGKLVIGLRPGLSSQHVIDGNVAFLDQAGLGVDDAIPLLLRLNRLPFEDDHPDIALVELAAALYRLH